MLIRVTAISLLLLSQWAFSFIQISGLDDIELGVWNGSGGLIGTDTYCLLSKVSAASGTRVSYDVGAYGPHDGAGNFVLQNTVDSSLLPIDLTWTSTAGSYAMTNYLSTGYLTPLQTGGLNCAEAVANVSISIEVQAADLGSASAGTYTGAFSVDGLQASFPRRYVQESYTVTVPELIQITDLDDIDLGTSDGSSDLVATDQLCIFRNGAADYALRASGGVNPTDAFELSNGSDTMEYEVAFREASDPFVQRIPGQLLGGLEGSPTQDCSGSTNAEVQVTVKQAELSSVGPGNYSGVLYIVAEPE